MGSLSPFMIALCVLSDTVSTVKARVVNISCAIKLVVHFSDVYVGSSCAMIQSLDVGMCVLCFPMDGNNDIVDIMS